MASERVQRQIDRLLDEAERAFAKRDWPVVRDNALDVIGLDPDNPDALTFLNAAERALSNPGTTAAGMTPAPSANSNILPTDTLPTSFANGGYQVKRFLGEGGKKKVYLARDTLLDREVAFALIKTEGLDQVSRTRITREAQAMGRLGSHPHIVTGFDLGQEASQPYMVAELMGGGDVEGGIEDATDHRISLDQAIDIAKETCRGLEFVHSRGIVQRNNPGDREKAMSLLDESLAISSELGMRPLMERVLSRRDIIKA